MRILMVQIRERDGKIKELASIWADKDLAVHLMTNDYGNSYWIPEKP